MCACVCVCALKPLALANGGFCVTPQEELSEKKHCAEGVFSWWVKLISPAPLHGACSEGSELGSGWHQVPLPSETAPVIVMPVAHGEGQQKKRDTNMI